MIDLTHRLRLSVECQHIKTQSHVGKTFILLRRSMELRA